MRKELYFVLFAAGAVIGAAVAWHYVKKAYGETTEEETYFNGTHVETEETTTEPDPDDAQEETTTEPGPDDEDPYTSIIQQEGYSNDDEEGYSYYPQVIPPEEFGELDDYDIISLTYYADGILADDDDEPLEDVEDAVGDAVEHFGEYEDDSVFVRNDRRKCYYEILYDSRTFSEAGAGKARRVEVR